MVWLKNEIMGEKHFLIRRGLMKILMESLLNGIYPEDGK